MHHGEANLTLETARLKVFMELFGSLNSSSIWRNDADFGLVCYLVYEEIDGSESCFEVIPDGLASTCARRRDGMQVKGHDLVNTHELKDLSYIHG